jgi:hypothetical protein
MGRKGHDVTQKVDIWVDPVCPFAWVTAQWLLEVQKVRDVEPRFNIMSLAYLNEGREGLSDDYRKMMQNSWGPVRVGIAVEQRYGKEGLRAYYLHLATMRHNEKRGFSHRSYETALERAGLDPALAAAAEDASLDDVLKASHHAGMDAVGSDVGTPVIHFPRPDGGTSAFFGPVISKAPQGEEAGRLWDGLSAIAETEGLYELKRTRDRSPEFLPMEDLLEEAVAD